MITMDPGLQTAASTGAGVFSLEDLSDDLLAAIARCVCRERLLLYCT